MPTFTLKSGYSKSKEVGEYRPMTPEEAKLLKSGDHVPFRDLQGTVRTMKVNGQPKTWKRDPDRVEVPGKYGMYEYCTFRNCADQVCAWGQPFVILLVQV